MANIIFKPKKSRAIVIRKGKFTNRVKLQVQVVILLKDNPIKCLGKWFDGSLTNSNSVTSTEKQTE